MNGELLPAGVSLRDAQPADRSFLVALYAGTRAAELSQAAWSDAQKRAFCATQFDLQDRHYRQHYPGARFLVVELAAEPVGRLIEQVAGDELRLMDIIVDPVHRRRGIGGALVRMLCSRADREGLGMRLFVERHNPIRGFYERLGFVVEADESIYMRMKRPPVTRAG